MLQGENHIDRVFVHYCWARMLDEEPTPVGLVSVLPSGRPGSIPPRGSRSWPTAAGTAQWLDTLRSWTASSRRSASGTGMNSQLDGGIERKIRQRIPLVQTPWNAGHWESPQRRHTQII